MRPDLDHWLASPALRTFHQRGSSADADTVWAAAREVRLSDSAMLGRLVRWRIPGTRAHTRFDELFRCPPFMPLEDDRDHALVSGLVGRIWTLRRDYPVLEGPEQFREWSTAGTAKVLFATWVESSDDRGSVLSSETRVQALGVQGRVGVAAVRPLVASFQNLIGSDGIAAAVRRAERA